MQLNKVYPETQPSDAFLNVFVMSPIDSDAHEDTTSDGTEHAVIDIDTEDIHQNHPGQTTRQGALCDGLLNRHSCRRGSVVIFLAQLGIAVLFVSVIVIAAP